MCAHIFLLCFVIKIIECQTVWDMNNRYGGKQMKHQVLTNNVKQINYQKDELKNNNNKLSSESSTGKDSMMSLYKVGDAIMREDYLSRHRIAEPNESTSSQSNQNITETTNMETSSENNNLTKLQYNLQKNVLESWSYKDYIKSPGDLMLDQGLINRAKISVSTGRRLRNMFEKALKGEDIHTSLISSSVSRVFSSDPSSKQWLYPNALLRWWSEVVTPITNSHMVVKDLSIAGVGSDYFSRCLKNHVPEDADVNLILWELSGSDYKPHGKLRPLDAESLERFLRNTLEYKSNPEVILLNFFRGNDLNKTAYCKELDEDSEAKLARHYDCTALSWSRSICPYLNDDEEGFSYSYLFSRDRIHPSIIGHAQMAYILIDYIRDEFLSYLQDRKAVARSLTLPKALFTQVFNTLCYTTLKAVDDPPEATDNSDLPIIFIAPETFQDLGQHRSNIGKLSPKHSVKPTILRFSIPGKPTDSSYRTLGILSYFFKPKRTVIRIDDKPFVPLKLNRFNKGKVVEIEPAVQLTGGDHMLRIWSLDKRFKILAITIDDTEHSV